MKKLFVLISVVMLTLMISTSAEAAQTNEYTIMIYMNGSDLESDYYAATDDLLEMISATIPSQIAVIVQTGGTRDWHIDEFGYLRISETQGQRWRVTDTDIHLLQNIGSQNMGESATLSEFIQYGVTNYPSDQYGLILWNHGAGAIYGYGADELFNYDTLTLNELNIALKDGWVNKNDKLDFVGFDACLMGSVEVAQVLSPYADYLIGSEELEPGHGWDYKSLLNYVGKNQNTTTVNLGKTIINGFEQQAVKYDTEDAITLSLIDLSKIGNVTSALDAFYSKLVAGVTDIKKQEQILKARWNAESYGEGSSSSGIPDSDMVDIIDFASKLKVLYPIQSDALIRAVQNAVVYSVNSPFKPKASGLSVYMPSRDRTTMKKAVSVLTGTGMSEVYLNYVQKIADIILNNEGDIDYTNTTNNVTDAIDLTDHNIVGDNQYFYLNVNPTDISKINEIYTLMGHMDSYDDIQYLARTLINPKTISDKGTIVGRTIDYWVNVNGVKTAMYYDSHDETGTINYYIPMILNDEDADLIVHFSPTSPNGKILGARRLDIDHENIYNRSLIALKPTDEITFIYQYDLFDDSDEYYYYDGWYSGNTILVGDGLNLDWQALKVGTYTYCFELVDVYGNTYYSDWLSYAYTSEADGILGVDPSVWSYFDTTLLGISDSETYPWLTSVTDLPSSWAYDYIQQAYDNGLTTPSTLKSFKNSITREAFCELAVKMIEVSQGKEIILQNGRVFSDSQNTSVLKAAQIGVVKGFEDGSFRPDDLITREQLITMFYRSLIFMEKNLSEEAYPHLNFKDTSNIASWALDSAEMMVYFELINGVGNGLLAPKDNATIEQSLKLVNGVYEFYQMVQELK